MSRITNYVQDLRLPRGFMHDLPVKVMLRKQGPEAVIAILRLWDWVAGNFPTTGRLENISSEDIYLICEVPAENHDFIADMIATSNLSQDANGTFFIPDWMEKQPYAAQAEERRAKAKANADKRWAAEHAAKHQKTTSQGNAAALQSECSNSKTNSNTKKKKATPFPQAGGEGEPISVSEIVALFCKILPELPEPPKDSEKLEKDIATRCKAKPERQSIEWWTSYFTFVREHPYLMGEVREWRAGLAWLVCRANMDKVLSGHYVMRKRSESKTTPTGDTTRETKMMSLQEYEQMRAEAKRREVTGNGN